MGFGAGLILIEDHFIGGRRLIKFADHAEMIGAVEEILHALIIDAEQGYRAAAAIAYAIGLVFCGNNIPAAHFAFQNRHRLLPPVPD